MAAVLVGSSWKIFFSL